MLQAGAFPFDDAELAQAVLNSVKSTVLHKNVFLEAGGKSEASPVARPEP